MQHEDKIVSTKSTIKTVVIFAGNSLGKLFKIFNVEKYEKSCFLQQAD